MGNSSTGRKPVQRAVQLIECVAGSVLGMATILIVASAIGRYVLAVPVPDAFDLSRLILGVAIAWGFASVAWHGTHIKVDFIAHACAPAARRWVNLFAWLVLLVFTALMTWKIWERVDETMAGGDATMDMRLPLWPFFLAIWLGLLAGLFTNAMKVWRIFREGSDLEEFDGVDEHLSEERQK